MPAGEHRRLNSQLRGQARDVRSQSCPADPSPMPTTTRAPAERKTVISGRDRVVGRSMCVFWYVVSAIASHPAPHRIPPRTRPRAAGCPRSPGTPPRPGVLTREPPRDDDLAPGVALGTVRQQLDQGRLMRDDTMNLLGWSLHQGQRARPAPPLDPRTIAGRINRRHQPGQVVGAHLRGRVLAGVVDRAPVDAPGVVVARCSRRPAIRPAGRTAWRSSARRRALRADLSAHS